MTTRRKQHQKEPPTWGEAYKAKRIAAGVAQKSAAVCAGISGGYLSDLEAGRRGSPMSEGLRWGLYDAIDLADADREGLDAIHEATPCPTCGRVEKDARRKSVAKGD